MPTSDAKSGTGIQEDHNQASSFQQHQVLRAFKQRWRKEEDVPFRRVVIGGHGPFPLKVLRDCLTNLGMKVRKVGDMATPSVLVLGRQNLNKGLILELIQDRVGKKLRICSQEMLLSWAMTGVDPNQEIGVARTFIRGHPGLSHVSRELGHKWPGTDPIPHLPPEFGSTWRRKSPLKEIGYTTGSDGLVRSKRRRLLREAYERTLSSLPGTYSADYVQKWGEAKSSDRLRSIAKLLAENCRDARTKQKDCSLAIEHWKRDLMWLKETFYNSSSHGFAWPSLD